MRNNLIIVVAFSIFAISCGNSQNNTPKSAIASIEIIVNVDAITFKELTVSTPGNIVDVRTPEEWAEGTLKDAVKINYHDDDFIVKIQKLDKEVPVYVYCRSGGRSSSASDVLEEQGFTKVYNLEGGITSWKENHFEVIK